MIATISTAAATWWWIGLALVLLVITPIIALLAYRLVQVVAEIRRYADDIVAHGGGLATELEAVAALGQTRELTGAIRDALARYASAVGTLLGRSAR